MNSAGAPIRPRARHSGVRFSTNSIPSAAARSFTTHLGDLKAYAVQQPASRERRGGVRRGNDAARDYRLHIGQFGMSNALKIARRLKLPKELLKKALSPLEEAKGRSGRTRETLQELRIEAEQAKGEARLAAKHEADRERHEGANASRRVEREAAEKAAQRRTPCTTPETDRSAVVMVPRFGSTGRVGEGGREEANRDRQRRDRAVGSAVRRDIPYGLKPAAMESRKEETFPKAAAFERKREGACRQQHHRTGTFRANCFKISPN